MGVIPRAYKISDRDIGKRFRHTSHSDFWYEHRHLPNPPPELSVFDYAEPVPFLRDVLEDTKAPRPGFFATRLVAAARFSNAFVPFGGLGRRPAPKAGTGPGGSPRTCVWKEAKPSALRCWCCGPTPSRRRRERYDRLLRRTVREPGVSAWRRIRFALVSEWYHWALLEMVALRTFGQTGMAGAALGPARSART